MLSTRFIRQLSLCQPSMLKYNQLTFRNMHVWRVDTLRLMKERDKDFDLIPHKERHRREWADWNYNSEIYSFGKRLGEEFPLERLIVAFTDQSYIDAEIQKKKELGLEDVETQMKSNQELSQKGGKILADFASSYLRYFLPRVPEEGIRSMVNYLFSPESLSHIGCYIGCKELIMSPLIHPTSEMISNAVKSIIALLEETKGSHHCQKFIIDIVMPYLHDKDLLAIWDLQDPELKLKKILKNDNLPDFEPRLLRETGRNTILACYIVGLYVNKNLIGYGPGESVEIAKEMAAYDALRRFFQLTVSKALLKFGPVAHNMDYKSKLDENISLNDWRLSYFTEGNSPQELTRKIAVSV